MATQLIAYWLHTGAIGLAVSYTIASILTGLLVAIITLALRSQREWLLEWTRESFAKLWEMAWLFIKTVVYQFVMRLFIEVGTIVISLLGPIDLAAQFFLIRYGLIVLVTGLGFWSASVAIMGRAAGAGKRSKFVKTFIANLMLFVTIALLTFLLLLFLRYQLGYWSTSIVAVQQILGDLTPCVAVFSSMLLLWIGSNSLLLSLGRVNVPTATTVFCDFIVGIPLSMYLTFGTPLKLYGFYIGLVVNFLLKFVILWTYYACYWSELMSTISNSNSVASNSESSPFLPKTDPVESTQKQSSAPEILAEGANGYGTADSSTNNDTYLTTNKQ